MRCSQNSPLSLLVFVTLCFVLGVSFATRTAAAQDRPGQPDLERRVAEFITKLGASTASERAEAEQALIDLGPDALRQLPPLDLLPSLAVRRAVVRIRRLLEFEAARRSLQASRVTLEATMTRQEAAAAIVQQTGNVVSLKRLPESLVQIAMPLRWSETRFWDALAELAGSRIDARFSGETGELELVPMDDALVASRSSRVTQVADAFRIVSGPVSSLDSGAGEFLLKVEAKIDCEPRLRPLFLRFAANDLTLRTEDGRVLPPFSPGARIEVPLGQGGREATLQLAFSGTGTVPKSFSLRGAVSLLTAAQEQPIVFREFENAHGVARRSGGVTVTVTSVSRNRAKQASDRPSAEVRVRVAYDAGTRAFESHQLWLLHNRVYLETPDGSRIPPAGGIETLHQGDGIADLEYRFVRLPESLSDWQFTYLAPTLLLDEPIEISLEGIPVPPRP